MKKRIRSILIAFFVLLVSAGQVNAQGWTVNPADYGNSGQVSGIVLMDEVEVTGGVLGAFVGEECRGYVSPSYFPPSDHYIFTLLCYSNVASGETLTFKYYDGSTIYDVNETIPFTADMIIASALFPFEFTVNTNSAPVVDNPISDIVTDEHFSAMDLELGTVFSDPDSDPLSYSVSSSSTTVATVSVSGTTLTITEVAPGSSTITVTASDGSLSVDDVFYITINDVNDAPVLSSALADLDLDEHFSSTTVSLVGVFTDPDGDGMTYSATSSNTGVVTVGVSGTTLTLTEVAIGSSTITVTASDGTLQGSDAFLVTVNDINDAPVVSSALADLDLDEHFSSTTVSLAGVFTDPDGDGMTYSATSSNTGIVTVAVSGTTLTITEVAIGSSTITVTASDGTLQGSDAFLVTVNDINDAPVVSSALSDLDLDEHFSSTTVSLVGVFTDPDGDGMTYSATSSNTGIVTVGVSGTTLTITEVANGSSTITVIASDGTLQGSDAFLVTVSNVNDAPVVSSALADLDLDEHFSSTTVSLVGVFTDPDGDGMTYSATSSNTGVVTVGVSGTTLTLTEVAIGSSTITVTASDGFLEVSDAFLFTINDINDAPVVSSALADLDLDEHFSSTTVSLAGVFTDPDGDGMTYSATSSNTGIVTVGVSGTTLTITEVANGSSTITVTASDGTLQGSDAFLVTVSNVNDAPVVATPISDQVLIEHFTSTTVSLSGVFTDPDGDGLSYSASSSNTGVITVGVSGTTLTLSEAGSGSSTITVTASDGFLEVSDEFLVTVTAVNDPPYVASAIPDQGVDEHFGTINIDLSTVFTDPEGLTLSYTPSSSNTDVVTVSVSGDILTVTETGNGVSTVTVTASDGNQSVSDQFVVTVTNVNDAPIIISPIPDQDLDEHFSSLIIPLSGVFSEPDGDFIILSVSSSNTAVVSVSLSGTNLILVEKGMGEATITVSASDGILSTNDQFVVTVTNVNDMPVLNNPIADQTIIEHFSSTTIDLTGVFSDPDSDPLTLTASSSNSTAVTVSVSGQILTITETGVGISYITVTASDGELSTSDQFKVTVENVNDAPEVINPLQNRVYQENFISTSINIATVFTDPDGDIITYSVVSSNTNVVTVSLVGTVLTITEKGLGESYITITASDGSLSTDEDFKVTVTNVNDSPVVSNPIANTTLSEHFTSTSISLAGVFSDPDGDELSYEATSSAISVVTVAISGSNLVITELGLGVSNITVSASDGSLSASDQFTITVVNVNDAPVIVNQLNDVSYNEYFASVDIDLSGVFTDPDNDVLTLSASSNNKAVVDASVSLNKLTITEAGIGSATITVTATDGNLSTNMEFDVTVNNVNDAPVIISQVANQVLDEYFGSRNITIDGRFEDPDGDVLSYTAQSSNTGVVSAAMNGTTLTLTEHGTGSATITVTASDGSLSTDMEIGITVNNVNDAPVVDHPISDQLLVANVGSYELDLATVFSDKDEDPLSYAVVAVNSTLISLVLDGSIMTVSGLLPGSTDLIVTASDGVLVARDTFMVTVEEELSIEIRYDTELLSTKDTIIRCNDASEFDLKVSTELNWWSVSKATSWLIVEKKNDSILTVGYSENLTGDDRAGMITIEDEQGHKFEFTVLQSSTCGQTAAYTAEGIYFMVFPNPTEGFVTLVADLLSRDELKLEILDMSGRIIQSTEHAFISGSTITLDLGTYKPGVYLIRISDSERSGLMKVVKH